MNASTEILRACGLDSLGMTNIGQKFWDLSTPALYEQSILRHEGFISHLGPLVVRTGHHTGRSPADKFVVDEPSTHKDIWWGSINHPISPDKFENLHRRQLAYLQNKDLFIENCYVGAADNYKTPIRIITENAWHGLFARNMFIRELDFEKQRQHTPKFTVICTPEFHAVPKVDGTASEVFIVVHPKRGLVLIGGTSYAGEIKKAIFTLMHYLLPKEGVLSMHCSANYGESKNDAALFFGLSGTGKTALATSPDRTLIGDDEHGWSEDGIFNFEGGCYAKVIRVNKESEPEIYETTRKFGTILENVGMDAKTRHLNLDDAFLTENTRAAYPITHIPRADPAGVASHPKHIIFLTYDAFGILPPVARLNPVQAYYHFLSGYTSKVAGTETGVNEPKAVFSPCFAAPFLPLRPKVYAELLRQKIANHKVDCWLINTGLTGGSFGIGTRVPLNESRAIVTAILTGKLANIPTQHEPVFDLEIPKECPGVSAKLLDPRGCWSDGAAYDKKANELKNLFDSNFKQFEIIGNSTNFDSDAKHADVPGVV